MNTRNWHSLVTGTALLMLVGGVTNSCKDFLDQAPQGALDLSTLTTRTGVELPPVVPLPSWPTALSPQQ